MEEGIRSCYKTSFYSNSKNSNINLIDDNLSSAEVIELQSYTPLSQDEADNQHEDDDGIDGDYVMIYDGDDDNDSLPNITSNVSNFEQSKQKVWMISSHRIIKLRTIITWFIVCDWVYWCWYIKLANHLILLSMEIILTALMNNNNHWNITSLFY
jgi:hypothetical protein